MSFWDKVKKLFEKINGAAQKHNKEIKTFEHKYRGLSEGEWQQKIEAAGSFAEKTAIFNIAKRKGWVKPNN